MAMPFLEELRSADHATKKRWLIGLSAAASVIIAAVWLLYFNTLFIAVEPAPGSGGQETFSFFDSLRNGISAAWHAIFK